MKPALGWTQFSREALRKAEATVLAMEQGVRDEIGFLLLHQSYADRFFPGTSVLQTRLRYILFIPWMYGRIARNAHKSSVEELQQQEEMHLVARLKKHHQSGEAGDDNTGIIGSRSHEHGRLTTQAASMIYWGALGRWGLLKPGPDQALPSRSKVHRVLRHRHLAARILEDDDKQPLFGENPIFVNLPPPPPDWDRVSTPLGFALPKDSRDEHGFILRHLAGVDRPDGKQSLLASLAEQGFDPRGSEHAWDDAIIRLADQDDREALCGLVRLLHWRQLVAPFTQLWSNRSGSRRMESGVRFDFWTFARNLFTLSAGSSKP